VHCGLGLYCVQYFQFSGGSVTRIVAISWEEVRDWNTMMSDADQDVITQWECQCVLLTLAEHMHKDSQESAAVSTKTPPHMCSEISGAN